MGEKDSFGVSSTAPESYLGQIVDEAASSGSSLHREDSAAKRSTPSPRRTTSQGQASALPVNGVQHTSPILKLSSALRCSTCGTTDTPSWRRGPDREKVCNACGLKLKSRVSLPRFIVGKFHHTALFSTKLEHRRDKLQPQTSVRTAGSASPHRGGAGSREN
jgi:hypothetical protein